MEWKSLVPVITVQALVLCGLNIFLIIDAKSLITNRASSSHLKSRRGQTANYNILQVELGQDLRKRQARSQDTETDEPWQVNQNVCPPVLCGSSISSPITDGAQSQPVKGGFPFFEGDIVLDDPLESHMRNSRKSPKRKPRSIVRPIKRLWKYGEVPYMIDSQLPHNTQDSIMEAFRVIEKKTCLKFKPKVDTDKDYLYYVFQPGCWSYVGRKNGQQFISLGSGCHELGTVIHETGHALGFWHEQSRIDRDDYVRIVKKNVSPSAMAQFSKRTSKDSTSRGFPYDYQSIMHYGDKYFTRNGDITIKVKGRGKTLGFKIGQRRTLSELDVAQLRDMYYCNEKDARKKACRDGWIKHDTSCYKFVISPKHQGREAKTYCEKFNSHLTWIESEEEDQFLKMYLINHYSHIDTWRVGGKKHDGGFVWYGMKMMGGKATTKNMEYTAWAPNHPGKYSSMALVKYNGSPKRFVWKGVWTGSPSQLPKFSYSFICEGRPKDRCFESEFKNGRDYRGHLDYTSEGISCQKWTSQYPHKHSTVTGSKDLDENQNGLGDHNNCRNPGGRRARPWCYTTQEKIVWQYCDIDICD